MTTQKTSTLFQAAISTPRETNDERNKREETSLQIAKEMLNNGCCSNTVIRYTGLSEAKLKQL